MGIEIVNPPYPAAPGETVTATFANPVYAYAWGFWNFTLSYGDANRDVESYSARLQPLGPNGNLASVTVNLDLHDGHENRLSSASSHLYPLCVAVTGSPQTNTALSNVYGVQAGQSQDVSLPPSTSEYHGPCFLSGVNLSLDHGRRLLTTSAGCGLSVAGQKGTISATATMSGGSGASAIVSTVDVGYIVSAYGNPGFGWATVQNQTQQPFDVAIPGLTSIGEVVVMVQGWQLQYSGGPRKLMTMFVGSGQPTIRPNSNVVTVPFLGAYLTTEDGSIQDDSVSSCTALVIALP